MISVFIPVFNGEQSLPRTLDSVLVQTYADLEILCVDDSSTDGSYALLREYASTDSRIRLFQKPNGGSVPPSWEYIMPYIKGKFVLYMSQDDLLESNTIELLVKRQEETEANAVIPHEIHYVEGMSLEKMHHLKGINGDIAPVISGKDAFRLMIDYSISGRALWATSVIRQNGIRTDTFNADELAQRQWVLGCKRVAFSCAVFLYCRNNPQSITEKFSAKTCEDALTNAYLFQLVAKEFPKEGSYLHDLGNKYFFHLYQRMINYQQRKKEFTVEECNKLMICFNRAYGILHAWSTLRNWKFRVGSVSFMLFRAVVLFKCLQYRRKGVLLSFDLV